MRWQGNSIFCWYSCSTALAAAMMKHRSWCNGSCRMESASGASRKASRDSTAMWISCSITSVSGRRPANRKRPRSAFAPSSSKWCWRGNIVAASCPSVLTAVYLGRVNKKNRPVRDLVRNEEEAAIKAEVYHKIVDEGYGGNRIANWLNERGVKTKRGTTLWRATSVRAMIGNPIDRGQMHLGDTLSEPIEALRIVDDYYFYKAIEIIRERGARIHREAFGSAAHRWRRAAHGHHLLRRVRRAPMYQSLQKEAPYEGRRAGISLERIPLLPQDE